jgi:membrane protein
VFYFSRFAHLELVQGSIGSIIILLIWVYYSAFILVLGAEVSAEFSRMRLGLKPKPKGPIGLCP